MKRNAIAKIFLGTISRSVFYSHQGLPQTKPRVQLRYGKKTLQGSGERELFPSGGFHRYGEVGGESL